MRRRIDQDKRRAEILAGAAGLFLAKSFEATEMEHIRATCGLSRGGLYHHFSNKSDILGALALAEAEALCEKVANASGNVLVALVRAGSHHLSPDGGIWPGLKSADARLLYLARFEDRSTELLAPVLGGRLAPDLCPGIVPDHASLLFLTVNALINRRSALGQWTEGEGAAFAATALDALGALMLRPEGVQALAEELRAQMPRA